MTCPKLELKTKRSKLAKSLKWIAQSYEQWLVVFLTFAVSERDREIEREAERQRDRETERELVPHKEVSSFLIFQVLAVAPWIA